LAKPGEARLIKIDDHDGALDGFARLEDLIGVKNP
jgi:hypothetical protein